MSKAMRQALAVCIGVIKDEREVAVDSYMNRSGPDKGKLSDDGKPIVDRFDAALAAARAALALPASPLPTAAPTKGYYDAADEIHAWLNAQDSGEWTIRHFRSQLNLKLLEMRPASPLIEDEMLVEEVAQAICRERYAQQEFVPPWWGQRSEQPPDSILVPEVDKEMYRSFARAALRTIDRIAALSVGTKHE